MTINVYWDDVDPTIMRIDYSGEWTIEDQNNLAKTSAEMLPDENERNDVIVYVHEHTHFPHLVSPKLVHTVVQSIPTNPGVRVLVGAPVIMQTVLDMFSGLVGGKMGVEIVTAKTVDSARSLIRHKRTE